MKRGTRQLARRYARRVAAARAILGMTALVAPDLAARSWIGEDAGRDTTRTLARAMGGRDLVLGIGALWALRGDGPAGAWVLAGSTADAVDVVATVKAWHELPRMRRWAVAAIGAGATVVGVLLAPTVDG